MSEHGQPDVQPADEIERAHKRFDRLAAEEAGFLRSIRPYPWERPATSAVPDPADKAYTFTPPWRRHSEAGPAGPVYVDEPPQEFIVPTLEPLPGPSEAP